MSELLSGLDLNNCVSGPFPFSKAAFLQQVIEKLEQRHHADWLSTIRNQEGSRGQGGNKPRTYCLFKSKYLAEPYCELFLPAKHRHALAKFRCGVAPLRIETGRYERFSTIDLVRILAKTCFLVLQRRSQFISS